MEGGLPRAAKLLWTSRGRKCMHVLGVCATLTRTRVWRVCMCVVAQDVELAMLALSRVRARSACAFIVCAVDRHPHAHLQTHPHRG